MRKLRDNEIRDAASMLTECFADYPLYEVFFPNEGTRAKGMFYFFWFRLYTRRDFTYVEGNLDLVACLKRPGDEERSGIGLLLNPRFFFGALLNVPLGALKLAREFGRFEAESQKGVYHPESDVYVQIVATRKGSRGSLRIIKAAMDEIGDNASYCETHAERLVRLYELLGYSVCAHSTWNGIDQYQLRSEKHLARASKRRGGEKHAGDE